MADQPTIRPFLGEDDFPALVELLRAVAADDPSFTLIPDDYHYEWVDEEPGWINSRTIWEFEKSFAAMTGIWFEPASAHDRAYAELELHPGCHSDSLWDEAVGHMIRATADLIDRTVDLRLGVRKPRTDKRDALVRAGFVHDRVYNKLIAEVGEPIQVPTLLEGFTIRKADIANELDIWVETYNAGFAEHYDPPTTSRDYKLHQLEDPGYVPNADLVLVSPNGQLVGIGLGMAEHRDDGEVDGYLSGLCLRPEVRGLGLGRALLLSSMAALQRAGFQRIKLDVDSSNESGALRLYESVGFQLLRVIDAYRRSIQPVNPPES